MFYISNIAYWIKTKPAGKKILSVTITTSNKNKKKYIFNQKLNFLNYAFLFYFYKKYIYCFLEAFCFKQKTTIIVENKKNKNLSFLRTYMKKH